MQEVATKLYFKEDLGSLNWPDHEDAQYLKSYITPMMVNGTSSYIENIDAEVFVIKCGDKVLPGVIAGSLRDCYVASPYAHYVTYAKAELNVLDSAVLRKAFAGILNCLGMCLRALDINNVVYVNNWLLSTNLYIDLSTKEVDSINKAMRSRFPGKVIIYRSLNEKTNKDLMATLEGLGGKRTLGRQVYITDPKNPGYRERKDFTKDQKFLEKCTLSVKSKGLSRMELDKTRELYNKLYLDKYFLLNPRFTKKYFYNAAENGLFNFKYLSEGDTPKAVLGYFSRNGAMTTPIFGFDTDAPSKEGLYRLISSLLMVDSEKRNLVLNQSSGAAMFKRQRGAKPFLEYNYYFPQGCSLKQRAGWMLVSGLLNSIGTWSMRKFEL